MTEACQVMLSLPLMKLTVLVAFIDLNLLVCTLQSIVEAKRALVGCSAVVISVNDADR